MNITQLSGKEVESKVPGVDDPCDFKTKDQAK